ncbi:ABC transporter ATP-binding protein [Embleya sp. NPDC005575]|uniref:ABC transporter ATP-binding protein n=1 Tax=Embleya sp. NPDC005575 TaxID=3156892 RepID=UPI0033B4C0A5
MNGRLAPKTTGDPGQPIFRCRGLRHAFGDKEVLRGIDLEIEPGECFGLLGPNGAGKTTLTRIASGVLRLQAGEIQVRGRTMTRTERQSCKELIGVVPQGNTIDTGLTVEALLTVHAGYYRITRSTARTRAVELLARVGLDTRNADLADRLSGGQQRRLLLARALVSDPAFLIMDEPTAALDPGSRLQVWDVILGAKADGRGMLLTTHSMEEAERLCDRIGLIFEGRLVACGTPANLLKEHLSPYVLDVNGVTPPDDGDFVVTPGGFRSFHDSEASLDAAVARVATVGSEVSYQRRPPTLEDLFLKLTGSQL